ncbi:MAG TPA: DNA mismatch repair protein MutS [Clostridiaceae bacterium]|nr:DNA mismatch repair protein MutS [Clostridiaceae bacterium]
MDGTSVVAYIILAIVILIVIQIVSRKIKIKNLKKEIADSWGREPKEKYDRNAFPSVASYYNNLKENRKSRAYIDDLTWNDLDMDEVFKKLNCTWSSIGEEYLYAALRQPLTNLNTLSERGKLIEFFQSSRDKREKLLFCFAMLGKRRSLDITNLFFNESFKNSINLAFYRILSLLAIASAATAFIYPDLGLPALVIIFCVNAMLYYKGKSQIGHILDSVAYISDMVLCTGNILKLNIDELGDLNHKISQSYKQVRDITKKSARFLNYTSDIILEYVKVILLKEIIDFYSICNIIKRNREHLINIYESLGLIESMLAVASYRASLNMYCTPDFTFGKNILSAEDVCHPLLKNPVPNSISTERAVLLTGSNASGKSTFLKTLAINAIFAQTIYTCLAKSFTSNCYRIFTSMALKDSIVNNESYFIAEIKSLKRILDALNDKVPCLVFIDEVLRGTNTVERIAASSEVLFHLAGENCLCFAATHDIELSSILGGKFVNYHFREEVRDNEVYFDYRLYSGKATTRNAIRLLKLMGYSDNIVERAESRAASFDRTGKWEKRQEVQPQIKA